MSESSESEEQPYSSTEEVMSALKAFSSARSGKDKNSAEASKKLKGLLKWVETLGYSRRDIAFAVNVETLTVVRWAAGNSLGMKPDTFSEFESFIIDIVNGKSRRLINASDIGLISWRSLVHNLRFAKRSWYFGAYDILIDHSLGFKDALKSLFLSRGDEHPCLIHVYPPGSDAEKSLKDWRIALEKLRDEGMDLRGTIIGIRDSEIKLPELILPHLRAMLLEKSSSPDPVQVDGYVRIRLEDNTKKKLLDALDPQDPFQHTPWLNVRRQTAEQWYLHCENKGYVREINKFCAEHSEGFTVEYLK